MRPLRRLRAVRAPCGTRPRMVGYRRGDADKTGSDSKPSWRPVPTGRFRERCPKGRRPAHAPVTLPGDGESSVSGLLRTASDCPEINHISLYGIHTPDVETTVVCLGCRGRPPSSVCTHPLDSDEQIDRSPERVEQTREVEESEADAFDVVAASLDRFVSVSPYSRPRSSRYACTSGSRGNASCSGF